MPTKEQLQQILATEFAFPETRREDDPMYCKPQIISPMPEDKKYPIMGYAPGGYQNHCVDCKEPYIGDKRSWQCEPCAIKSQAEWDALTPEQQEERVMKNRIEMDRIIAERNSKTKL